MAIALTVASLLFFVGLIGLIAALTLPRQQRGKWMGIIIAMLVIGALGWLGALSFMFPPGR